MDRTEEVGEFDAKTMQRARVGGWENKALGDLDEGGN